MQSDLSEDGVRIADADDLIDVLRTAREADVAAVLKQQRDGRFKVSLRSRGATDVGSVAAAFGGGGHRLAAGYASRGGLAESVQRLREALISTRSPSQASDPA
jgi:phosphoesterase RecJ-like protein